MRVSISLHYFEYRSGPVQCQRRLETNSSQRLALGETAVQALPASRGDFTGLVDIGGRQHLPGMPWYGQPHGRARSQLRGSAGLGEDLISRGCRE
jgi:hypothetical protein